MFNDVTAARLPQFFLACVAIGPGAGAAHVDYTTYRRPLSKVQQKTPPGGKPPRYCSRTRFPKDFASLRACNLSLPAGRFNSLYLRSRHAEIFNKSLSPALRCLNMPGKCNSTAVLAKSDSEIIVDTSNTASDASNTCLCLGVVRSRLLAHDPRPSLQSTHRYRRSTYFHTSNPSQ
ncbi:hypothetical protein C8R46DRAFT_1081360 [Mycena filopes]|nr:hypothetical protein C8R46DRAFT_1081335 [Mycena filopes]KAJ7174596.1 hypothetical protein C8R46DRAFT_1081360 [Mycena filopes]